MAFCVFAAFAIYITYPLIFYMGDLATGAGDELVIAWIQNWVIHSLSTNPLSIFDANLYFPYHNTLAYSDLFLTSSILSILPLKLIGQPISVVNFTFISSLVLLGFSVYLLCFYLTKDFLASFLSGLLIIFSPAVLDKATHLQILSIQWVPLSIFFFLIFIIRQKSRYLAISLFFFLLQTYNSFLPGYFIIFSYLIIFLYSYFCEKKTIELISKKNILIFIFSIVLVIPIIIPYYRVSKEFNYTRGIREAIHFAIQPEDLLYPGNTTRLKNYLLDLPFNKSSQNGEFKPAYLGFVFTILAIYAFWRLIKNFKKRDLYTNSFLTISMIGLILSFGPFLHLFRQTIHKPFPIPLPYALFYYIIPGFQGFRNSARWEMLFILCSAIVISLVIFKTFQKYSLRKRIIIYFLLFIGIVLEFNSPMHFVNIPQKKDFPKVYSWLNTIPKDAPVIIMPIYNWNMMYSGEEIKREYFSTINFRRTVNGYSGFSPPPWQKLIEKLNAAFPNDESIKMIKDIGVRYIIIDKNGYDKNFKTKQSKVNGASIMNSLKKNSSLKLVKDFQDHSVFKF